MLDSAGAAGGPVRAGRETNTATTVARARTDSAAGRVRRPRAWPFRRGASPISGGRMAIASLIGPDGWSVRVRIRTMAMPEESAPPPLAGGGRGEGKTAPRQVRLRRHHARYS